MLGWLVGRIVGGAVGESDGAVVGSIDGMILGNVLGMMVGKYDGPVGEYEGKNEGEFVAFTIVVVAGNAVGEI